jgi:hypothetical protein
MQANTLALLIIGATACPAFAAGSFIEAKSSTFGCQFSATLGLFATLPAVSEDDSNRILDTGHCVPIGAHQRFAVLRDLPSAYVALTDTHQDDHWVVVFVRKSDFDLLQGSSDQQPARERHGTTHSSSRKVSPSSRAGTASTGSDATADKPHHSRIASGDRTATTH